MWGTLTKTVVFNQYRVEIMWNGWFLLVFVIQLVPRNWVMQECVIDKNKTRDRETREKAQSDVNRRAESIKKVAANGR